MLAHASSAGHRIWRLGPARQRDPKSRHRPQNSEAKNNGCSNKATRGVRSSIRVIRIYRLRTRDEGGMTLLKRNETPLQPQKGIATRNGIPVAIQVKFSGGPYPDRMSSDGRIDHIGEGRSGRQVPLRGNKAMLAAEQLCTRIPVYDIRESPIKRLSVLG
jgi:hypothetical protein